MVDRPLLAPPPLTIAPPSVENGVPFYRCSPVSSITEIDESCLNESEDSGNIEEPVFPDQELLRKQSRSSRSSYIRQDSAASRGSHAMHRSPNRMNRFHEGGRADPGRFRLSVNKQRSNSECVFNKNRLNGLPPSNGSVSSEDYDRRRPTLAQIAAFVGSQRRLGSATGADGRHEDTADERGEGGRLIQRQHLFHARRVTSDFALFFSLIGIVMMVLENELSASHICDKGSLASRTLKFGIVFSTAVLVMLVARFHIYEVQLFMNANSAEDWRIAFTWRRIGQITLEILACGICPLPFDWDFQWTAVHADGETVTTTWVSLDVLLSIPMFFRLYWLCRVMLLHSRMFTDASSRSIAGLNRVNFNARFILKTLMTMCPGTIMLFFTASLWIIAAWIMRLCERYHAGDPVNMQALKHQNYLNSLWLIAITFLSVGYGDIVPNTYCGRSMAVITGILGTCTSSMVVAVIARKLELSRAEKHVQNFMMDTHLTKMLKHSAANVLRETWLIYKYRRLVDKIDPGRIRMHQRKFLVAIYELRKVKRDQRKLAENSVSLGMSPRPPRTHTS
ncbi:hypothetical protein L596_008721 [Steinernema carpocapsae]|uniref:Calmodulin-binding domain-containing protein n=1 Tax=Steinernema carpocapsae TaxID=34508 RepID=A0A4U5PEG6_STECR|nr:hypothetical protein L596_008721 [Steinernema carpocapsae]